jgi:hypothetical protein
MKRFTLIVVCLALICPVMAWADHIYAEGNVSGVWSVDTVFVTGSLFIQPGDTLIIEPGVEVIFLERCEIVVDSSSLLLAVGTETDSIWFSTIVPGFTWVGFGFYYASDSSRLEYCIIRDACDSVIGCYYSSPTIRHCSIIHCSGEEGTIKCSHSNAVFDHNFISGNSATNGGAFYCFWQSSPVITNNIITNNMGGSYGGAIYCYNHSNPVITGNTFSDNIVTMGSGGAIACFDSNPVISGNSFISNDAMSFYGGAIFLENSNPEISNNSFYANSARGGGGIYCYMSSNPVISRNLMTGNHAGDQNGGAITCLETSSPTIINNTIVGNFAGYEGGGILCISTSNPAMVNNILWDNTPEQISFYTGSQPEVTYSDVQNGWEGLGNISDNPEFVDPIMGDFHLAEHSPCIDTGDPNSPLDPDSTRADMGAYYYNPSAGVPGGSKQLQPLAFCLFPNYPNPFNPTTTFSFVLPMKSEVELAVYNVMGQRIATLINGWQEAGIHQVRFDGTDLASGMYFYQLEAGDYRLVRKAILLK